MSHLDDDIVALMTKRVYDIAGSTAGIRVFLNGEQLRINGFLDYIQLFLQADDDGPNLPLIHAKFGERWEVAVSLSDGQFEQVSFVNSIATIRGGTHVNHVADQLTRRIADDVNAKNKLSLRPFQVKQHLWLFVNCLIENPAFDSQTKCTLTSKPSSFGSSCSLDAKFMTKVIKCGVVTNIMAWSRCAAAWSQRSASQSQGYARAGRMRETSAMRRQDGSKQRKVTIPKLDDANHAGGPRGKDCTLILTEGDSAKALAVSGLGVVGRDKFGVFPLRGKLLNVRDASVKQVCVLLHARAAACVTQDCGCR